MAVVLVKAPRVSLVKSAPRVSLRKPVRRLVRLWLASDVLAFADVVELTDGTVWYADRRRPGRETVQGERTVWTQVSRPFNEALTGRREFEAAIGALRWSSVHDRMS
ncbi:MAG: hypothetical protein IJI97_06025 [Clostridia bacterium]|nr:hypothetical protein [Clostridia bacterium]